MRADEFVGRRQKEWERLEALLRRASRGGRLHPEEAIALAALYRRATADLARAQRDWPEEAVTRYLNGLVGRGHGTVYRGGGGVLKRLWRVSSGAGARAHRGSAPPVVARGPPRFGRARVWFLSS